ncbi:uncharacterized protein LOC124540309 [Vanessa cardui]|uniref:uncharacterized protein LOC124540309 n=1 Tax=Vanessa cardui TaxID=171605 RepID=UPI001F12EF30|nr:uncharacterized protein LOC124540309 [Vanessa cardui]
MKYFIVLFFVTPSLCQYGLRPDVTFGERNDRFDVANLLRHQKNSYKDIMLDAQSEEEYRRRGINKHKDIEAHQRHVNKGKHDPDTPKSKSWVDLLNTRKGRKSIRKKIVKNIEDHVNQLANTIITKMRSMRRYDDDFAYHDNMNSGGGDVDDYNANLKNFDDSFKDLRDHNDEHGVSARRLQHIVDELHGSKQGRRMISDPEQEILLHYAFPLDVKIEGFLQRP